MEKANVAGLVQRLKEAVGTGEIISIVYFGGTQPGTRRDVLVVAVRRRHLAAMCLETNKYKTFRLDRMQLAEPDDQYPPYDRGIAQPGLLTRTWLWLRARIGL